jgi:hypothetical protein
MNPKTNKNINLQNHVFMKKFTHVAIFTLALFLIGFHHTGWTQVVISQVYGGGGNTGAPYNRDFIELFNRGATSQDLNGWTIQYASATGSTWTNITPLGNITINPGQYILIGGASGANGIALPTVDVSGTINMSGTAGKVALVSSTTALTGSCPTGGNIVDFVGFGTTANCFEGSGPTPAPSNTTSVSRASAGCQDDNNNATDFTAGTVNPRNSSSPLNVCSSSAITLSTSLLSGFTYAEGSGPSAAQSFIVGGTDLTANVFLAASTNYEISLTSGSGYTTPIELTQTAGTLAETTIFVRLKAGLAAGTYNGETINITSTGATPAAVTCNGSVTGMSPQLSVDPATLTGFTYGAGNGPSASGYYTLSGIFLTGFPGDITITGSANFEVSNDDATWGPSTTVEFTSATLDQALVFVRLKAGLPQGTYNGELIGNAGGGASNVNVTCSGSVTAPQPTAACTLRPSHIDISTATSESAVLMTLSNYASDLVKYRIYGGSGQYYCWDEITDSYITSSTYANGPSVPGTPSTSSTFWILFQNGSNNTVEGIYRDRLGPAYGSNYQTLGLPTAASITTPFNLSGNFVPFGGYDNTIKHVVLAYSGGTLVSATSNTLTTGAFNLVCPDGTTIDLIEVRAIDNTLIASRTGSWSTTTNVGNVPDLPVVAPPVISPLTGIFYEPFDATITCSTPASSIYYTTDGSDPDNVGNGTLYTIPVPISTTTTLKAKAYATGFDPSIVVSAVYTFPVVNDVANIAALRAGLTDGTAYRLTGEAILTFKSATRNAKYIQDATGAIIIDDVTGKITTTYNVYDGITGITGTLSLNNLMLQFVPVSDPGAATSTGNSVVPEVVTLVNLNDTYQAKLVKVIYTTITGSGNFVAVTNYPLTDPSGTGVMRTHYSDVDYIGTPIPAAPQNLTGVILQFGSTMQLVPRGLSDFEVSVDPSLTATPNTLSGFLYAAGNGPSTSQSYVLEGSNLNGFPGDITVSAAGTTGYEVSNDDINFSASVTVPFTSAVLAPATVHVRLKAGLESGAYNSQLIVHTGGGILLPVNVTCSGTVLAGEPTNHATAFTATSPLHSVITITWSDNDGAQPADGFLVLANTTGIFTAPVDGVPQTNNSNLGGGSGVMNVAHGVQMFSWGGLSPETPYYFVIYPYTNAGALINYKTTPEAPTATATTLANISTPVAAWTFDVTAAAPNTPTVVPANYGAQSGTATLYSDGTNGSSLWVTSTSGNELTMFAGTTINDPRTPTVSGSSYCPLSGTNNIANGKSMVLKFSMTDFEDPILSYATRFSSATGFNNHQWAWSTDGTNFTDFGVNTAPTTTSFVAKALDLSSIDALDDAADVYLRITFSGATSGTSNNRLDNFVINATPVAPSFKTLNVSVLLEGLYEPGTGLMRQAQGETGPQFGAGIADQVTVELHEATSPFAAAYTFNNVDLSTNGTLSIGTIPTAISGSYYVVIKHRNSIETWSSAPVSFDGAGPFNYDFTTAASQAFGDNLLLMGTAWVIYGGDVSQDGGIDTSDMTEVDNDAADYAAGYINSDVNGDGGVDTSDMTIIDNNSANYIGTARP